jgi:hypothetical protein
MAQVNSPPAVKSVTVDWQQLPSTQRPPVHEVPFAAGVHESPSHVSHSGHVWQNTPADPHALSVSPGWQVPFSLHPLQHVPPTHCPEGQSAPSAMGKQL